MASFARVVIIETDEQQPERNNEPNIFKTDNWITVTYGLRWSYDGTTITFDSAKERNKAWRKASHDRTYAEKLINAHFTF